MKKQSNNPMEKLNPDPFFNWTCDECGKVYDATNRGKVRMGETFCSLECADKAYPNFNTHYADGSPRK